MVVVNVVVVTALHRYSFEPLAGRALPVRRGWRFVSGRNRCFLLVLVGIFARGRVRLLVRIPVGVLDGTLRLLRRRPVRHVGAVPVGTTPCIVAVAGGGGALVHDHARFVSLLPRPGPEGLFVRISERTQESNEDGPSRLVLIGAGFGLGGSVDVGRGFHRRSNGHW